MLAASSRPVGATNARVSRIGFGAAPLGNLFEAVSDADARAALEAAWDAGLRYVDTAPYYGFGLSERRVGDFLREQPRGAYAISTKVGRLLEPFAGDVSAAREGFHSPMPFEAIYDYSYDGVMASFEASLQRLGLAHIDLLLVHDIGAATHGSDHERHWGDLFPGGYRALDALRSAGAVSAIGLGVNEWQACVAAMEEGRFDVFLLAGRYTLLEQGALEVFFPACARHGASVVLGGVYNSGILATGTGGRTRYEYAPAAEPVVERVRRIEAVCGAFAVPLAAAALQFPLAHPQVAAVIPGIGSARHALDTLTLAATPIPPAFWRALKDEGLLHASAPTAEAFTPP